MAGESVLGDQPLVGSVGDLRGAAHRLDLAGVLDGAQLLDQAAGRHQLGGVPDEARQPLVGA